MKNICLAFIPPLSAFMSHYEWLLKIDWKTWCRVASSTTFALHITCNEWVTSTFWHHIFCHCRNLFEALLLLYILRNKNNKGQDSLFFVLFTKPHHFLRNFLNPWLHKFLSRSYQITLVHCVEKIPEKSFVGNWGVILVALKPYVWHWKLLIYEDCFLSWIDLHHVKSSVVAQSIISSEDSWVDPSTNATQLTEKYKQQLGADKFILHATTVFLNTKWWWSKINKEAFGQEKK